MEKYKIIQKKVDSFHGKKVYLIGEDAFGVKYWLVEPSWDCGWYWGFGYLESFTNNNPHLSKDISCHTHVSTFSKEQPLYDCLAEFKSLTMNQDELFQFADYMRTFYNLKETAEILGRGYLHVTERAKLDCMKNPEWVDQINKVMLPELFKRVLNLLEEEGKEV